MPRQDYFRKTNTLIEKPATIYNYGGNHSQTTSGFLVAKNASSHNTLNGKKITTIDELERKVIGLQSQSCFVIHYRLFIMNSS